MSEAIKDDILDRTFSDGMIRKCPHPRVIEVYGHNGTCNVSIYSCLKCKYCVRYEFMGAIRCGYEDSK